MAYRYEFLIGKIKFEVDDMFTSCPENYHHNSAHRNHMYH